MTLDEIIEKINKGSKDLEFIKTGFASIDNDLDGGFLRKELVVIGAFTGIGKSYLAGQILYEVARQGFKCAYISLEISNETVVSRLLGALANIKSTRIRAGLLTKGEYERKIEAQARLRAHGEYMSFYDDIYDLETIVKTIRERNYEFVVIDFIQNIFFPAKDEYTRLSHVALQLQRVAKEQNCCILALSQLSNQAAKMGRSGILEYKGSGNIATVCDLGFIIERTEEDKFILALQKNRRGSSRIFWNMSFRHPGGWIYETSEVDE